LRVFEVIRVQEENGDPIRPPSPSPPAPPPNGVCPGSEQFHTPYSEYHCRLLFPPVSRCLSMPDRILSLSLIKSSSFPSTLDIQSVLPGSLCPRYLTASPPTTAQRSAPSLCSHPTCRFRPSSCLRLSDLRFTPSTSSSPVRLAFFLILYLHFPFR